MKTSTFSDFAQIVTGNRVLKRITQKRKEKRDFAVLVMPESDRELNECALKYLDDYCMNNYIKELFIVTNLNSNILLPSTICDGMCKIKGIRVSEKRMCAIVHLSAVFYAQYFCVISLRRPYGRNEYLMIGHKHLTLDDIVCRCLYNLKEIPFKGLDI